MRASLVLGLNAKRLPRLLASEILEQANAKKLTYEKELQRIKGLPEDERSQSEQKLEDPFFATLPPLLKDFFARYPPAPFSSYADKPTSTHAEDANPFLPNKHPFTGRWHGPKYSLRQQADLWKIAYRYGIDHLLPKLGNDKAFYEERYVAKKFVDGASRFKLTKSERNRGERQKEIADAVANADELIAQARGSRVRRRLARKAEKRPAYV
jgi:large subunit ribosomal protein L25